MLTRIIFFTIEIINKAKISQKKKKQSEWNCLRLRENYIKKLIAKNRNKLPKVWLF